MSEQSGGYEAVSTLARVSRSGSDTRARSQVVMVRLTPEEKAALDAAAERQGCSPPEMLRRAFGSMRLIDQMQETETRDA